MTKLVLLPLAFLAACSQQPPAAAENDNAVGSMGAPQVEVAASPTPDAAPVAMAAPSGLAGRWVGVEGMYLVVTPGTGDKVALEMQWDLDNKGSFDGRRVGGGIAFTRDGKLETLKPTNGDATGLKYLAGKKDCLTVKPGEGYCRS